jgi:hypothetical protein
MIASIHGAATPSQYSDRICAGAEKSQSGLDLTLKLTSSRKWWWKGRSILRWGKDSNLVDSASSHTLVSKIAPCMSKYKSFTLKRRTAHYNQL